MRADDVIGCLRRESAMIGKYEDSLVFYDGCVAIPRQTQAQHAGHALYMLGCLIKDAHKCAQTQSQLLMRKRAGFRLCCDSCFCGVALRFCAWNPRPPENTLHKQITGIATAEGRKSDQARGLPGPFLYSWVVLWCSIRD